ncbi:HET-domain-containing protein, partial [Pseudovirgaria hyperparasitica]
MVDSAADADLPDCESDYSANLVKSTEEGQRELKPSRHVTSNIRLMNATTHTLREFVGTMVPEYAILSHTWLPDGEVLFEDMADLRIASRKPGFKKIELTCKQALCDGLDWVWVDTCCIDKKSSAELSEAINSMFDWYRCSTLCYAYLSDIEGDAGISESRWFTRGWTLQELIAPNNLMFYSRKWRKLGSRYDRAEEVSSRTKIGVEFLNREGPGINPADVRQNLKKASVAYKMSWASDRTTTRIEDNAYSLLGIFQVNMPLLYGEGNRAFGRLQEEIMRISDDQSMLAW